MKARARNVRNIENARCYVTDNVKSLKEFKKLTLAVARG